MPERIVIGLEDFLRIRQRGAAYVDRTAALGRLLRQENPVSVICRPRRFGKSLLLSTLRAFLERGPDHSPHFEGLAIWQDAEARAHFGRYPVLHLSFKSFTGTSFAQACLNFSTAIRAEWLRLLHLWPGLRRSCDPTLRALDAAELSPDRIGGCLLALSIELAAQAGERVVVLLDEYDTPLHRAQEHGFYPQMLDLLRDMLDLGLKSNSALAFAVVTGVLRVSREGLWSSFNNPRIYSVLDPQLSDICGFTEEDVVQLLERSGSPLPLSAIQRWYNGYQFGGQTIYSPWSVLCALESGELRPWWTRSGSPLPLGELLRRAGPDLQAQLRGWMEGGTQTALIGDSLLLREDRPQDVVPLLVHSGYLTQVSVQAEGMHQLATLRVPNLDVLHSLADVVGRWFAEARISEDTQLQMKRCLLNGDLDFGRHLGDMLSAASTHDFPYPDQERGYHVFLLGLLAWLRPEYRVVSNLEAGAGRADILVLPAQPGGTGVLIEVKRARSARQGASLVKAALQQAVERRYDQRLREAGAARLVLWGVAFWGKDCRVAVQVEQGGG